MEHVVVATTVTICSFFKTDRVYSCKKEEISKSSMGGNYST